MPSNVRFVRVRLAIDCDECANPIPVNGLVPSVLCGTCQAIVSPRWDEVFRYQGDPCREFGHRSADLPMLDFFIAGPKNRNNALRRFFAGYRVEIDDEGATCAGCGAALDAATLVEAMKSRHPAACRSCGQAVPLRAMTREERKLIHPTVRAIAFESAPRGDLREPETKDIVAFACLHCGAPAKIDGRSERIIVCDYCHQNSYMPDALWLRLHPAQRKRPFFLLIEVSQKQQQAALHAVH